MGSMVMSPSRDHHAGRDPGSDIVIDDLAVSRLHSELWALPDGRHEIVDLGSHNGTFLNGQPVARAVIGAGDIVGIATRADN